MRKKIFAFCCSILLMGSNLIIPVNIKAQGLTIEIDDNPDQGNRVFIDGKAFGIRVVGCTGSGGDCTATIVIQG
ncbi:MAG: hypothetical protein HC912_03870 [Saprospiraceae bacterium]|nr:hypothetical protein [Saprospiraceae bacterium]